jgi:hypothetical protein
MINNSMKTVKLQQQQQQLFIIFVSSDGFAQKTQ